MMELARHRRRFSRFSPWPSFVRTILKDLQVYTGVMLPVYTTMLYSVTTG